MCQGRYVSSQGNTASYKNDDIFTCPITTSMTTQAILSIIVIVGYSSLTQKHQDSKEI